MIQDPSSLAHEINLLATALQLGASTAAFTQWSPIALYAFQFYTACRSYIARHDVRHVLAVSIRQQKVSPARGNGNPYSVPNHGFTTEDTSPCKPLFVVRLKPAMAIFETLMLPKQHLT